MNKLLNPTKRQQEQLADFIRNPHQALLPDSLDETRAQVYVRLVRNGLANFVDSCFSDSQAFVDKEIWQNLQYEFLDVARPTSPFFNDIAPTFLAFCREKQAFSDEILQLMDFEVACLQAEIAIQSPIVQAWHDEATLGFAPATQLKTYSCDFVSSRIKNIEANPVTALVWRDSDDEVCYRALENSEVLLAQYFSQQNNSYRQLLQDLSELLQGQDISNWLKSALQRWHEDNILQIL